MSRVFVFLALAFVAVFSADLAAADLALPDAAALDGRWKAHFASGTPQVGSDAQDLSSFLLEGSLIGWDPERLSQAVGWLESLRQTDPHQKGFMNLYWYWGDTKIEDTNGVEFLNRDAVLAWILARNKMLPGLKSATQRFLQRNLEGIRNHRVDLDYTNITLMKAWNLIALGDSLPDPTASAEGKRLLQDWVGRIQQKGIREFLSPTYTAVDLENLGLIQGYALDSEVRRLARAAMDYQWAIVLAHWYRSGERMGGTHSRDYDRLTGHGALDTWVKHLENPAWPLGSTRSDLAWSSPSFDPAGFELKPGQTALVRWDQDAWATWSRGQNWGLGSATENYYNMDKTPFVLDLANAPGTPVITFWMDGRGDYYGLNLIRESSGHRKSLHLRPSVASAQRKGEVLFVASGDSEGQSRLDSTITLPADARYWIDGEELGPFHHRSLWVPDPLPTADVTAIRVAGEPGKPVLVIHDGSDEKGIGVKQVFPVTPGFTYRTQVTGTGGIGLYHNYYDSLGRLIGHENIKVVQLTGGAAVQETVAPAAATTVKVWLYSSISRTGDFQLTGVQVQQVSSGGQPSPLAGFDWEPFQSFEKTMKVGSTLAIRLGSAGAVLRPVEILDSEGQKGTMTFSNDGLPYGAFRLTATHSTIATRRPGIFAMYVAAADIPSDASFLTFVKAAGAVPLSFSSHEGTLDLQAVGLGGPLKVKLNPERKTRSSEPEQAPSHQGTFWIDGNEVGESLFSAH